LNRNPRAILLAFVLLGAPALALTAASQTHAWGAASIDPTTGMIINPEPVALVPEVEDHRVDVDFDGLPLEEIVEWLRAVPAYAEVNFVVSPKLGNYGQDAPIFLKLRSVSLRDLLSAISIATDDRVTFEVRTPTMVAIVPGPGWQPPPTEATPPPTRPVAPAYQVVNLREFHEAYFDRLYRFLLVLCQGRETDAREALQDTLCRVVRHARSFEDASVFWCWLMALARSAAADAGRKRHRYWKLLYDYAQRWLPLQRLPPADLDQPLHDALLKCLQDLDAADRQLVEAKYFARRSTAELARETGLTERAVESRLFRLRGLLRERVLLHLRKDQT
jgi:RNA polymerase sigma-70 factor (ECF subfamily)